MAPLIRWCLKIGVEMATLFTEDRENFKNMEVIYVYPVEY